MYERFKKLTKRVVPKSVLDRYDTEFRKLNAVWYRGNKVTCNCCGYTFSRWITLGNGELLCPRCGSLPRTRRLHQLLQEEFLRPDLRMLHFSPSRTLNRVLSQRADMTYDSTDFVGEFAAKYRFDILNITMPVATYDLIVCFHVLEHIEDDRRAMAELFRVLKPGGTLLVQTPFKAGEIYEDPNVATPEGRLAAFGQDDHVRVYSVKGLARRLTAAGFAVDVRSFTEDSRRGMRAGEMVLVCSRPTSFLWWDD